MKEHNKIMREINKKRYRSDPTYRKEQLRKGNLRNKAISELINKHRKEFEEILRKIKR